MKTTKTPCKLTEDGRRKDSCPILPGDIFMTVSGRLTSPYPKQKAEKYASQWLCENATIEAQSRGDLFNSRVFKATRPMRSGELTQSDRDSMLMYLFSFQPEIHQPFLRPLESGLEQDHEQPN